MSDFSPCTSYISIQTVMYYVFHHQELEKCCISLFTLYFSPLLHYSFLPLTLNFFSFYWQVIFRAEYQRPLSRSLFSVTFIFLQCIASFQHLKKEHGIENLRNYKALQSLRMMRGTVEKNIPPECSYLLYCSVFFIRLFFFTFFTHLLFTHLPSEHAIRKCIKM